MRNPRSIPGRPFPNWQMKLSRRPICATLRPTDIRQCYALILWSTISLACAVATGEIRIMSDGSPWRPLIHCRDIARAFSRLWMRRRNDSQQGSQRRRQRRELSGARRRRSSKEVVPSAKIAYTGEIGADPRNYRVKFDLLNKFSLISNCNTILRPAWTNYIVSSLTTVFPEKTGMVISLSVCVP